MRCLMPPPMRSASIKPLLARRTASPKSASATPLNRRNAQRVWSRTCGTRSPRTLPNILMDAAPSAIGINPQHGAVLSAPPSAGTRVAERTPSFRSGLRIPLQRRSPRPPVPQPAVFPDCRGPQSSMILVSTRATWTHCSTETRIRATVRNGSRRLESRWPTNGKWNVNQLKLSGRIDHQ